MIRKGDKFRVNWKGHEESYVGRIYQVTAILHDCTCPNPNRFVNGVPRMPRRPHAHICANMIECSYKEIDRGDFNFNGIDEDKLVDIECPDFHLEIVYKEGDQLSLF